jgi:hypothetical protein
MRSGTVSAKNLPDLTPVPGTTRRRADIVVGCGEIKGTESVIVVAVIVF